MVGQFKHTATDTIRPPGENARRNLVTRTSGEGEIDKQLGYILISDNVKTWRKYTKVKEISHHIQANRRRLLKWKSE